MKDEILNIFKENVIIRISFIFIFLFPIILLLGSAILNLSIVNSKGQVLKSINKENIVLNNIDISNLIPGKYFLKLKVKGRILIKGFIKV